MLTDSISDDFLASQNGVSVQEENNDNTPKSHLDSIDLGNLLTELEQKKQHLSNKEDKHDNGK